jgi:hypothetical protein
VYEALDHAVQQIRLAHVRRNERGVIECDLITFSLEHLPPYVALSYVWGAPAQTQGIVVNHGCFDVRQNLYNFLNEYCNEEQAQYIWIDQICINQCDIKERGHQVGVMTQIYSQAAYVVVWLSSDERYQEAALKLLTHTAARDWQKAQYMEILLDDVYFTRLWVVQEFLLAREVRFMLHGNVWLSWTSIGREGWADRLHPNSLPRMSRDDRSDWHFERYIAACSSNKCQNPLDRVYGLLGLAGRQIRIIPDYEKPAHDLFIDVVNILATDYINNWTYPPRGQLRHSGNDFGDFRGALDGLGKGLGFDTAQLVELLKLARDVHWKAEERFERDKNTNDPATLSLEIGIGTTQPQGTDWASEETGVSEETENQQDYWWLTIDGDVDSTSYYYCKN